MELSFIPSPSRGVVHLGPIPLRGYAFCIIIGVFVAVWLGNKRWIARGGKRETVADIAVWAVPFGLVGGRLYHVITDYELYFTNGNDWVNAFKVWDGGLGIWGAIALGALGAWIGCRRRGIALPAYADAIAPGIAFAQAIGRWGNWFNQELYGNHTSLPWGLKITSTAGDRVPGVYQPTFLYECLWCIGVGFLVLWADRRFKLGHGRAFALYVAAYCVGRGWIEHLRSDYAHHILGLRLNDWTAIIVFLAAVAYFVLSHRLRPGRELVVEPGAAPVADGAAGDGPGADGGGPAGDGGAAAGDGGESAASDGEAGAAGGSGNRASDTGPGAADPAGDGDDAADPAAEDRDARSAAVKSEEPSKSS
jgi:prolipoprotein diacylglyceryl transferase